MRVIYCVHFFCWLSGHSAFILLLYSWLAGRKIHTALVAPAALITQGRLCNCVGGSIVLAIGSLLTVIQKRSPLSSVARQCLINPGVWNMDAGR